MTDTAGPPKAGLVLTALVTAALVCNLNVAAANVALPDIGNAFGAPQSQLNLVGVGAGLGLSMSVLYFGALSDRYGRKQLLMIGLSLVVVASFLSAFAPSIEVLIFARVFTGLAAGMAYPTTLSLITALWKQGPSRTGAIAIWSSVGGMASVAGAIVAGLLLAKLWWGSAFLVSAPIALIALVLVLRVVPSHVGESTEQVDHFGGALSTLAFASLVLGISTVFDPGKGTLGIVLLILSAVLLVGFAWRQTRAPNPLFDLTVARQRVFWAPAASGAIVFGGFVGTMFIGEQFMQNILGYTPLDAGLAVVPAAVGLIAMAPFSARLVTRSGTRRAMLTGYSIVFVGFVTMLFWREGTTYPLIGAGFLILGSGASFVMTASSRALTSATPIRRVGMASATSDLQGDLGGSIMQALLGALLATGFSRTFAELIQNSPEGSMVTDEVSRALQASFASAARVAEQSPKYHDIILEAARQSLVEAALGAYLVGAIAIAIGIVVVLVAVPGKDRERELTAARDAAEQ